MWSKYECDFEGSVCAIAVYSLDGLPLFTLSPGSEVFTQNPIWSPDGHSIAFNSVDDRSYADGPCGGGSAPISTPDSNIIEIVEIAKGQPITLGYGWIEDWSPDGNKLLVRSGDGFSNGSLFVLEIGTGVRLMIAQGVEAAWQPGLLNNSPSPEPSPTAPAISTSTSVPTQSPTPDVLAPTPTQSYPSPEPEQPERSEPSSFFQAPWFGPTVLLVGFVLFVVGLTGFWKYRN